MKRNPFRAVRPVGLLEFERRNAGVPQAAIARELGWSCARLCRWEGAADHEPEDMARWRAALERVRRRQAAEADSR